MLNILPRKKCIAAFLGHAEKFSVFHVGITSILCSRRGVFMYAI